MCMWMRMKRFAEAWVETWILVAFTEVKSFKVSRRELSDWQLVRYRYAVRLRKKRTSTLDSECLNAHG